MSPPSVMSSATKEFMCKHVTIRSSNKLLLKFVDWSEDIRAIIDKSTYEGSKERERENFGVDLDELKKLEWRSTASNNHDAHIWYW